MKTLSHYSYQQLLSSYRPLLLVAFIFLFFSNSLNAQNDSDQSKNTDQAIIEFDYATGKFINLIKHIEYGNTVLFKVTNINRQAAETQIGITLIDYESEMPDELRAIFERFMQIEEKEREVDRDTSEIARKAQIIEERVDFLILNMRMFEDKFSVLVDINTLLHQIEIVTTNPILSMDDFFTKLEELCTGFNKNESKVEICTGDKKSMNLDLQKVNQLVLNFNRKYFNVIQQIALINQLDIEEISNLSPLEDRINSFYKKYEELQLTVQVNNIYKLIEKMKRPMNYEQVFGPVQASSSILRLEYSVENFKNEHGDDRNISLEIPVSKKDQITFSTGIALNRLYPETKEYSIISLSDNTSRIDGEEIWNYKPSVSFFVHYFQTCSYFGRRIKCERLVNSMGIFGGISTEGTDLADATYSFGASFIFGRSHRFNFNAGVSLKKVDNLKSRFKVGETYSNSQLNSSITRRVNRPGFMFGVSYSIINRSERN